MKQKITSPKVRNRIEVSDEQLNELMAMFDRGKTAIYNALAYRTSNKRSDDIREKAMSMGARLVTTTML